MTRPFTDDAWRLPDVLWERIAPLLPPERPKPRGGRPRMANRQAMEAILYLLRTGCQWKLLPRSLGAASTVHDRFQAWQRAGVFAQLWQTGVLAYDELKGLDWTWQAMDGAMSKAPLGGKSDWAQPHRPRQAGDQAKSADRRAWHSRGRGGGRRQSP
jgi:transposase